MEEDCVANGLRGGDIASRGRGIHRKLETFFSKDEAPENESASSVGDSSGKIDRMEGEGVQKPLEKEKGVAAESGLPTFGRDRLPRMGPGPRGKEEE